jgi:hypothetical protein
MAKSGVRIRKNNDRYQDVDRYTGGAADEAAPPSPVPPGPVARCLTNQA